jgi:hypothetical protein
MSPYPLLFLALVTTPIEEHGAATDPLVPSTTGVLLPEAEVPVLPHFPICFHLRINHLTLFHLRVRGIHITECSPVLEVLLMQLSIARMVVVAFTGGAIRIVIEVASGSMLPFL